MVGYKRVFSTVRGCSGVSEVKDVRVLPDGCNAAAPLLETTDDEDDELDCSNPQLADPAPAGVCSGVAELLLPWPRFCSS